MTNESELSKAKAVCDQAFKEFMKQNVLFVEHPKENSSTIEDNFFKALHDFHRAYDKYTKLQNSNA